ncbi:poly [ADP-ribose] polymerase tankyrase-2-like isoform X1 [Oryza brachyantha]|uniref:poly [ADP-ribose] polymerase tankyrase-2-like isoform X1 n=1 Tax=Oryza brachyantha TaxID=4533 RepID=UPI000776338F|nr:poly [ADP-ribose] polymerase tankyrase-2-like isoform X1 [Oryza brachyantha]
MASSSSGGGPRPSSRPPALAICKVSYSVASRPLSSMRRPFTEGLAPPPSQFPDSPADRILSAATKGDVPGLRKLVKRLRAGGKIAEEEVAAVCDPLMRRGPLHMAALAGRLEMCKFLIKDLRFDVNVVDLDGATPLHFAIQGYGFIAIVRLLLDRGADLNKADRYGHTPLHAAINGDMYEITELLLSRGAYVDPICEKGAPLHIAAKDGNARMMELLLQHQADPNRVVQLFCTPIIVAIFSCSLKCVELLIKAGADVNSGKPVTPLLAAANDGLADCIKCLLEAGADANIPDEIGRMPVEIAAIQGWKECVEILFPFTSPIARFADWNIGVLFQHVQFGSPKTKDHVRHDNNGSFAKVEGDDAFEEKKYADASALYTAAIETDTADSTLYAKRSLCGLHLGERNKALEDARTYKEMGADFSKFCYEQGAALILLKDYGQACKALMSGLKLDFRGDQIKEASRMEEPLRESC